MAAGAIGMLSSFIGGELAPDEMPEPWASFCIAMPWACASRSICMPSLWPWARVSASVSPCAAAVAGVVVSVATAAASTAAAGASSVFWLQPVIARAATDEVKRAAERQSLDIVVICFSFGV